MEREKNQLKSRELDIKEFSEKAKVEQTDKEMKLQSGFKIQEIADERKKTNAIVRAYANPEDINSSPDKAPSKRLLAIHANYDKILEGNLIALCVGIDTILNRCPRFKNWIEKLIAACHD